MSQVEDKKIIRKFFSLTKNRILKSEFNKNVLILAGGTTIAQIIPIAISPILTRLYTPEDFGALAIFVAITSVISVISCGRYELAIMLPEKDEDAINVAAVAFLFNIFVSTSFLIFISLFGSWLLNLLNAKNLGKLIYLAPLTVFLMGTFNILNYTNNRFKLYKDISKANIYKSIAGAVVQIVMGFFKTGTLGLISGQIVSQLVSNGKLFSNAKHLLQHVEKKKIKNLRIKYIKFPKYSLWTGLLNTLSLQIVPILLSSFFTSKEVGSYYIVIRVLSLPMTFIGQSFSQVFFQEFSSAYKTSKESSMHIMISTEKKLFILAITPFTILFFFSNSLFTLVFGKEWELSGIIARYLSPWLLLTFVYSPISITFDIIGKQKEGMYFQILFLVVRVSSLFLGYVFIGNFINIIKLFGFVSFLLILSALIYINNKMGITLKLCIKSIFHF